MHWLIAYDISHPRRLRRVARLLERRAVRCQYSVFLFDGTRRELVLLLDDLGALLRREQDVIQAWPAGTSPTDPELARGSPRPILPACVVLEGKEALFVSRRPEVRPD